MVERIDHALSLYSIPVLLTGKETEDHWLLKIKRTNLALYFILIVLLLAGIYFSKASTLPA